MTALFFPMPIPGETIYSLRSRYHLLSGNKAAVQTRRDLQLPDNLWIQSALPQGIRRFAGTMPPAHPLRDPATVIRQHSILPFYQVFRDRASATAVEQRALDDGTKSRLLGLIDCMGHGLAPEHRAPAYCRGCMEDDLKEHGFTGWHRAHQIPVVSHCIVHDEPLYAAECAFGAEARRFRGFVLPDIAANAGDPPILVPGRTMSAGIPAELAKWTEWMLGLGPNLFTVDPRMFFRREIYRRKLLNGAFPGFDRIALGMEKLYGKQLLSAFGPGDSRNLGRSWMARAISKSTLVPRPHSCRYLLLARYLFDTPEELAAAVRAFNESMRPTDDILDPRMAKLLELFDAGMTLTDAAKQAKTSFVTARAVAEILGVKHVTRPNARIAQERHLLALQELMKGKSRQAAARAARVSTSMIEDMIRRNPQIRADLRKMARERIRVRHRRSVESHMDRHPAASRSELHRELATAMIWLNTHDRHWIMRRVPTRRGSVHTPTATVDYAQRDSEYVVRLNAAADELRQVSPPVRISMLCLFRQAGITVMSYVAYKERLPNCRATVMKHVETTDDFHKRKIAYGVKQIAEHSLLFTVGGLHRSIGLAWKDFKKLRKYVEVEVAKYPFLRYQESRRARAARARHQRQGSMSMQTTP